MNLYLRFFNDEVLVENVDQAIDFLSRLPDVKIDEAICSDLRRYAESSNPYPKRFKISSKVYFIVIKTTAKTMEEFKAYQSEAGTSEAPAESEKDILTLAAETGLCPTRLVHVYSKPGKPVKRILLELAKRNDLPLRESHFYVESESSPRSDEYTALTKQFYL